MSTYQVLNAVSLRLRALLWQAIRDVPALEGFVASEANISLCSPAEAAQNEQNRLSVWLYQVSENAYVKNTPVRGAGRADSHQRPPLALNLYYLITPIGPASDTDVQQLLLGKVLQAFHGQPVLPATGSGDDLTETLRITLAQLTLEETTRLWDALGHPYRLSICYQVGAVQIEASQHLPLDPGVQTAC